LYHPTTNSKTPRVHEVGGEQAARPSWTGRMSPSLTPRLTQFPCSPCSCLRRGTHSGLRSLKPVFLDSTICALEVRTWTVLPSSDER
jgi:hypothetical protein